MRAGSRWRVDNWPIVCAAAMDRGVCIRRSWEGGRRVLGVGGESRERVYRQGSLDPLASQAREGPGPDLWMGPDPRGGRRYRLVESSTTLVPGSTNRRLVSPPSFHLFLSSFFSSHGSLSRYRTTSLPPPSSISSFSLACPRCWRLSGPRCLCSTRNLPLVNYAPTIVLGLLRANWASVVVTVISSSRLNILNLEAILICFWKWRYLYNILLINLLIHNLINTSYIL